VREAVTGLPRRNSHGKMALRTNDVQSIPSSVSRRASEFVVCQSRSQVQSDAGSELTCA